MIAHSASSPALLALLFAGAVMLPSALSAQQTLVPDSGGSRGHAVASAAPAPALLAFAPRSRSMSAVRLAPAGPVDVYAPLAQVRAGPSVAMMAAGGAGLAAGLLIGGDAGVVIASTGTVIGLVGLFRYMR